MWKLLTYLYRLVKKQFYVWLLRPRYTRAVQINRISYIFDSEFCMSRVFSCSIQTFKTFVKDMFWKLSCLEKKLKQNQMKQKLVFINASH